MKVFIVLAAILAITFAQIDESPKPYAFNYLAEGEEGGSSTHEESGDGSGIVRGVYTVNDIDGRRRIVEYVAGPDGFTANVQTNEPGTDNSAPADVVISSTAEEAKPMMQAAPQVRPQAAPRPQSQGSARFVLVPETDPRARAYYGAGGQGR